MFGYELLDVILIKPKQLTEMLVLSTVLSSTASIELLHVTGRKGNLSGYFFT